MAKQGTKLCKYCKTEIPAGAKICPNCKKKQGGALKWVVIVIVVLVIISAAAGGGDKKPEPQQASNSNSNASTEQNDNSTRESQNTKETESDTQSSAQEPSITLDEIKSQAQELKYKEVMRNPENYTGQYFYAIVKISSAETGSFFSSYDRAYRAYTNDEYNMWLGDMMYLLDNRDTNSSDYLKILEDDIIKVYGRFDKLVETKNALNGTKGEEMSLQLLYAELISE